MKKLFFLLFILTSCMSNNTNDAISFNEKNLYDMTMDEYKEMLINYNNNNNYPNIDK